MLSDLNSFFTADNDFFRHDLLLTGIAVLAGLYIGRLINIIADRLPVMIHQAWDNYLAQATHADLPFPTPVHLFSKQTTCSDAQHNHTVYQYLPLISSLHKCRECQPAATRRYLAAELLSGILSGLMIWHFGLGLAGISALVLTYGLMTLAIIDSETMLLPDTLTIPLLWLGLIVNLFSTFTAIENAIIGAAAGYLFLWIMHWLYKKLTHEDGIGYGDFKLLAALGAWLGWQILPILLLFASIFALIVGILLLSTHKLQKDSPIPFGPYLALSGILALLFGPYILTILF